MVASVEKVDAAHSPIAFSVRYEFPSFVETSFSGVPQRGQ